MYKGLEHLRILVSVGSGTNPSWITVNSLWGGGGNVLIIQPVG